MPSALWHDTRQTADSTAFGALRVAKGEVADYVVNYLYHDRLEYPLTKRGEQQDAAAGGGTSVNQPKREAAATTQPAWAKGLQRLYDQVVEEDLPDDLAALLDKLDRAADDK